MKQLFPIREWLLYIFGLLIVWNLYHPLPSFYIEAHFSFIPVTFLFGHLLSIFLMVMEVLILMYFINEYESMRLLILVRSRSRVFIGMTLLAIFIQDAKKILFLSLILAALIRLGCFYLIG